MLVHQRVHLSYILKQRQIFVDPPALRSVMMLSLDPGEHVNTFVELSIFR